MLRDMKKKQKDSRNYLPFDEKKIIKSLGNKTLVSLIEKMLLIRNFEMRAEAAYQQGKIGGFFHAYTGQEAIQTAAYQVLGSDHWYTTTYRCHALALLLGATPQELMDELFGRATGNAKGRGGSMHFYTEQLLGGFGIVGGHVPIATGAAFSIRYQNQKEKLSICFLGDGAVAQGAFHESLNLASLWDLPCIFVIENNQWGMGTSVEDAIAVERLAEDIAPGYGMNGYSVDGMDFFSCYEGFERCKKEVIETKRPVLIEAVCERFKGHSISDPGLYRTKKELEECKAKDPIVHLKESLIQVGLMDEAAFKEMDKQAREQIIEVIKKADEAPWPDVAALEEGVFADE